MQSKKKRLINTRYGLADMGAADKAAEERRNAAEQTDSSEPVNKASEVSTSQGGR